MRDRTEEPRAVIVCLGQNDHPVGPPALERVNDALRAVRRKFSSALVFHLAAPSGKVVGAHRRAFVRTVNEAFGRVVPQVRHPRYSGRRYNYSPAERREVAAAIFDHMHRNRLY